MVWACCVHFHQWWTFFFVSPGIVTGFNNEGRLMWQVDALVTGWDISDSSPWAMVRWCMFASCGCARSLFQFFPHSFLSRGTTCRL